MSSAVAAERPRPVLRWAYLLGMGLFGSSLVGGFAYLARIHGGLPLATDPILGARQHAHRGDVAQAMVQYQLLARIEPTEIRSLSEMGEFLTDRGHVTDADTAFSRVLSESADDSRARHGLAQVRLDQQRFPEAIDLYEGLLQESPASPIAFNDLGRAYAAAGRFDGAIAAFEQAVAHSTAPEYQANLTRARQDKLQAAAALPR